MRPERWRRVRAVFERALELDHAERPAYLAAVCGADADLRRGVEGLLAGDGVRDPLLDRAPEDLAAGLLAGAGPEFDRIGPYHLVRSLGRGGMGQVYLARRDDGLFRQDVAIKLLRRGLDTEDLLRRFRAERQILADLGHPNIARLHDGGMAPDGRPYFVMEYLEGSPLTEYCDVHRLPIDARLRLFATVCSAVEHAHRRGIVHRDLKPGNILVTGGPTPEEGTVKLLDFGIAKVVASDGAGVPAARTRTGVLVMTPEYASPEQLRGGEVGPASDVYSLGVVLYRLLTGRPPHRLAGLSLRDIERVVCERPPAPPSTAASDGGGASGEEGADSPDEAAAARATTPAALRRRLRGELDHIALMALRPEPERRYGSAGALAEDVRRHLERRPVRARGDSPAYRARTFARRHRATLSGILAAAGLAAGVAGALLGVRGAPGGAAVEAVSDRKLVVLPFRYEGPAGQEYLAAGMTEAIGAHLAGLPELRVIAHTRALEYREDGHSPREDGHSPREIGEELGVSYVLDGVVRFERPTDPAGRVRVIPRLVRTSDEVSLWSRTFDQRMENVFAVQSAVAREVAGALRLTLAGPGPGAEAPPPTADLEAYRYYLRGNEFLRYTEDEGRLRLAVSSFERATARDPEFAHAWAKLSVAHTFLWHTLAGPSDRLLERAREAAENALSHDPALPESYYALGIYLYQGRRDYEQALRYFERALELRPNYPEALRGVGWVLRRQGRLEEALSHFEQLVILDPLDASHLHSVAFAHHLLRNYPEAHRAYAAALERAADIPLLHATWARMLVSWTGSVPRARERLREGSGSAVDNDFSRYTGIELELWDGRWQVALDRLRALGNPVLDAQPWYVPAAQLEAAAWRGLGRPDSARARLEEARRRLEERLREQPDDPRAHGALGRVYARLGRAEQAVESARRGLELMPPDRDAVTGPFRIEDLAAVYLLTGRHEEAIAQLETLLSIPGFASRESLKVDPLWAPLRDRPRFRALVGPAG